MWPCLQLHFLLSVQNDSVVSNFLIYCSSPWQVADLSLYEDKVLVTCLSFTFVPCSQLLPLQSLGRGDWSLFPQAGTANICPNCHLLPVGKSFVALISAGISVQYLNSDCAALLFYLPWSQKQGWGVCLELLIPFLKSPLGSWVPAGLMCFLHLIPWSRCFLYTVCVLQELITTSEVSPNQHCKADSRLLAMTGWRWVC